MNKEDKFIVINRKRFDELKEAEKNKASGTALSGKCISDLMGAIDNFIYFYELMTNKEMDQKYIVCNQDEPYANKVWNIILSQGGADE